MNINNPSNALEMLTASLYSKQADQTVTQDANLPALNFDMTREDSALIGQIVKRGIEMSVEFGTAFDHQTAAMDIAAAHCNGTPLKLLQLLMSSPDDFSHDFCGIGLHIDRRTAKFRNGFKPRFAVAKQ